MYRHLHGLKSWLWYTHEYRSPKCLRCANARNRHLAPRMDYVDGVFILTSSEYYSFTYFSHNHVANTSFNTNGTVDDQRIEQRTAANHPINAWDSGR